MTFESDVDRIIADRQHGSSWLVAEMIRACRSLRGDPQATGRLRDAFGRFRAIDRSMAVVHHFLDALEPTLGGDFFGALEVYEHYWSRVPERVVQTLTDQLDTGPVRLLTHSHSQVVIDALVGLLESGVDLSVWQTESHPGGEGRAALKELRRHGIEAELVPDRPTDHDLADVTALVLGMDQYTAEAFVNKVGSAGLVAALRALGKPVYVLGDPRKRVCRLGYSDALFETVPWQPGVMLVTGEGMASATRGWPRDRLMEIVRPATAPRQAPGPRADRSRVRAG
ncbi:eIF2B alpha/beta/delta subunit family protein [Tamilnaduibacter salinus]|uniref:hypothetical protein n=1 Tax=Tamilnaduibacter salinus TaxID=1484056 RepID=UPI00117EFE49|nr:hypothetical protein [Tamilnaduibacter salinus]